MKFRALSAVSLVAITVAVLSSSATTQQVKQEEKSASPEMEKLAKDLAGDWDSTETMERGELFPDGGSRHGSSHIRLTTGGTTLLEEGSSDGSAGELHYQITIWRDKSTGVYHFFTCFKDSRGSACKIRGTAHWEGDTFINDYDATIHGKTEKMKDIFSDITPTSYVLVEAIDEGNGRTKTLVTTRNTRR